MTGTPIQTNDDPTIPSRIGRAISSILVSPLFGWYLLTPRVDYFGSMPGQDVARGLVSLTFWGVLLGALATWVDPVVTHRIAGVPVMLPTIQLIGAWAVVVLAVIAGGVGLLLLVTPGEVKSDA